MAVTVVALEKNLPAFESGARAIKLKHDATRILVFMVKKSKNRRTVSPTGVTRLFIMRKNWVMMANHPINAPIKAKVRADLVLIPKFEMKIRNE